MDITTLEEKDLAMNNDYLISLVHKDLVRGVYYYYGKLDKKWFDCPNFKNEKGEFNQQALQDFYLNGAKLIISRYAKLTFSEDDFHKLQLAGPELKVIIERTDAEGTWLVCQISWMFFVEDENKKQNVMINLAGLKYCKTDYVPPIQVTDEFKKNHPEFDKLQNNEFMTISAKEALKLAKETNES